MKHRRTGELHRHRWSVPGARYFISVCTHTRGRGLDAPPLTKAVLQAAKKSDSLRDTETFAFTVMPDHFHWLFRLGARLSLGRVLARLKADTRAELAVLGLEWQRDFFERRLRFEESIESYGFYIFMNPYWAGLVAPNVVWPGWWCPQPDQLSFIAELNAEGLPPSAWLTNDVRMKRVAMVLRNLKGTQQDCAPTRLAPAGVNSEATRLGPLPA